MGCSIWPFNGYICLSTSVLSQLHTLSVALPTPFPAMLFVNVMQHAECSGSHCSRNECTLSRHRTSHPAHSAPFPSIKEPTAIILQFERLGLPSSCWTDIAPCVPVPHSPRYACHARMLCVRLPMFCLCHAIFIVIEGRMLTYWDGTGWAAHASPTSPRSFGIGRRLGRLAACLYLDRPELN